MYGSQQIIALIPARGGSKRLPRKNVLPLRGHPLVEWSIASAQRCPLVDAVVVSTDDPEIAAVARAAGAEVLERPAALAGDATPSLPVFQDALRRHKIEADVLLVLQPTSPFRRDADLQAAVTRLVDEDAGALVSVSKAKLGPGWMLYLQDGSLHIPAENDLGSTRTQDQAERYCPNGALYAYRREVVLASERYAWAPKTLPLVLEKPWDTDIDDATDFLIAKAIAHEFDFHCR